MIRSSETRNKYAFGLGTVGRDMLYALVNTYLSFYLTDVLRLPNDTLWGTTVIMLAFRIFDAVNDPLMGFLVDNTVSRYGKFKPWIAVGAVISGVAAVLLFTDFGLRGAGFLFLFAAVHLLWDIGFTANDIAYWSMMPSLSLDQRRREEIGAFTRVCANIGAGIVIVGFVPASSMLAKSMGGNMTAAYGAIAVIIAIVMCAGQCITLFGVKEQPFQFRKQEATTVRQMFAAIFKNDQLLYTVISQALFSIGYSTTAGFGLYFFKYAYGNENMYSVFTLICGGAQMATLAYFPLLSKRFSRKTLYSAATVLVMIGYATIFFAPMHMAYIVAGGLVTFIGYGIIQLLMLMFLADTIEYGQWKLGKRNESITFAMMPFINKIGPAIASGIVGITVIASGISTAQSASDVTSEGLLLMKTAMMIFPLICIAAGYILYRHKYKIDARLYSRIIEELQDRGDIRIDRQ
ncbi:MAG TPA: glycoside-pentoside-hexuronide (GPH):cation symporter [Feifaniaceae bacterium]|nr:glycoside-pentoside-hexuronide (GPH):cation symporter [Feifaniaceae bacterium]